MDKDLQIVSVVELTFLDGHKKKLAVTATIRALRVSHERTNIPSAYHALLRQAARAA